MVALDPNRVLAGIVQRAKAELAERRASLEFVTLIPDGQQAPRSIR